MKYLALAFCLAGCAGNEVLPKVGSALNEVRDTVAQAEAVRVQLEGVYASLCESPDILPALVKPCTDTRDVLDKVYTGSAKAHELFNTAAAAYDAINEAAGE